jgi:hypothetical protein
MPLPSPSRRRRLLPLLAMAVALYLLLRPVDVSDGAGGAGASSPPSFLASLGLPSFLVTLLGGRFFLRGPSRAPTFNIIVTTAGRDTLPAMLASIGPQLGPLDHITVISDKLHEIVSFSVSDAQALTAGTIRHIINKEPLGFWGHGSRSRWQNELPGDYHMNADDDDVYDPRAMEMVRAAVGGEVEPPRLLIFHMIRRWDGVVELIPPPKWTTVQVKYVGTPCGVYSKIPDLPPWHGSYGGDGGFYMELASRISNVTFVPEVFYQVGQEEDLLKDKDRLLGKAKKKAA